MYAITVMSFEARTKRSNKVRVVPAQQRTICHVVRGHTKRSTEYVVPAQQKGYLMYTIVMYTITVDVARGLVYKEVHKVRVVPAQQRKPVCHVV
jgi:hypothetical protein